MDRIFRREPALMLAQRALPRASAPFRIAEDHLDRRRSVLDEDAGFVVAQPHEDIVIPEDPFSIIVSN